MGIAGAVAGGTAAAGLGGALLSSSAAKSAANTQAQAANTASQNAMNQYYQTRADLLPYNQAGQSAVGALGGFLNGSNPTGELTALENTPGYQFTLDQGLKSVQSSYASRGLGISGAALKGAANYATGLAQQTYQQNLLNPLEYLGQLGESAGAQTGQLGVQSTANANQAALGGASASAAGTVGAANALTGGLNTLASAPTNYLLYNQLLNVNANISGNAGVEQGTFS